MNIFFFVESGLGNSKLLEDQVNSLIKTNNSVFVGGSRLDQEPGIAKRLEIATGNFFYFNGMDSHSNFFRHCLLLRKTVSLYNIEIIHTQTNWELFLSFLAVRCLKNKPKIIYTIHAFRNNKGFLKKTIAKFLISILSYVCSDYVIATCHYIKKQFNILKSKIYILNLGIDDEYIYNPYKKVDKGLHIIFPAKFRQGKRQELIIIGFANYINKTHDLESQLILPGDGENLEKCKKLARELKVSERIDFPGLCTKEKILNLYDQSNILICSSISETYCQSIVEGYCLGKCVLSTPVGIAPEIIDNKKSGYIFTTEEELTNLLIMLNLNTSNLQKICENNYNNRFHYSWSSISLEYISLLEKIL